MQIKKTLKIKCLSLSPITPIANNDIYIWRDGTGDEQWGCQQMTPISRGDSFLSDLYLWSRIRGGESSKYF
jgi:hypothetical protein